jgi:hypothetical protein
MENFIIEHKSHAIRTKAVGGFWIFLGIVFLIIGKDSLDSGVWGRSLAFFIIGVIHFTPLVGSHKSQIEICEGCLKIIWITWITKVTIRETEIESITLAEKGILINRKGKKAAKLLLYLLGKEQKVQVYKFFTEYAQQKNYILKK